MGILLSLLLVLAQDDLAARLKRDGARAADELGGRPELKPELERLAKGGDADAAWWAQAALAEIEARGKGGKDYVPSRRVTLESKGRPAQEVFRELLAPDGDVFESDPAKPLPQVDLSIRDLPVHAALDEAARKAGVALVRGARGALRVLPQGVPGTPQAYAALHSYELHSVEHRTHAGFSAEPLRACDVTFIVAVDPRVGWRIRECRWEFKSAVDDLGRRLEIEDGQRGWSGGDQVRTPVFLTLRSLPSDARRLARLRGVATLIVWRMPQVLGFADVLNVRDQVREAGPFTITFDQVRRKDKEWSASFRYTPKDRPGGPTAEEIELEDADGNAFRVGGASWGGGHLSRFFYSEVNRVPAKLRLTVYPDAHVRRVYFELRDIPLR